MKRLDFMKRPAKAHTMTRLLLLLILALSHVLPVSAQSDVPQIRLSGIINLPGFQNAIFEEQQPARQGRPYPTQLYYWLEAGQSMRSLKVIRIDADKGTVEAKTATNQIFSLPQMPSTPPYPAIQLQDMQLYQACDLYSAMAHRTLLRAPNLPNPLTTLRAAATNRAEVAQILAHVISSNHVQIVPDGEKFALIVPEGTETNPHSDKIKSAASKTNEITQAGEIDFRSVPMEQFLDVYQMLSGRQFTDIKAQPLPANTISLTTVNPLNREEVIYAFETLLAFQNIKVIPVGTNEAKIEWISPPVNSK
jgi:hypothetical protein